MIHFLRGLDQSGGKYRKTEIEIDGEKFSISPKVHRFIEDCFRYLDESFISSTKFGFVDGRPVALGGHRDLAQLALEEIQSLRDRLDALQVQLSEISVSIEPKRRPDVSSAADRRESQRRGRRKGGGGKKTRDKRRRRKNLTEIARVENRPIYKEALELIPAEASRTQIVEALLDSGCYAPSTAQVMATHYLKHLRTQRR